MYNIETGNKSQDLHDGWPSVHRGSRGGRWDALPRSRPRRAAPVRRRSSPGYLPMLIYAATAPANNTPPASSSSNSSRNSSSKPKPLPNGEKEAAEKVVYDINININIPPGGGFGTLIIVLIVGCGLFANKKIRKRIRDKDERINAGLPEPAKEPSRLILFLKWLGRNLKKARKWIGSKIAGEDFSKKKKKKRRH